MGLGLNKYLKAEKKISSFTAIEKLQDVHTVG